MSVSWHHVHDLAIVHARTCTGSGFPLQCFISFGEGGTILEWGGRIHDLPGSTLIQSNLARLPLMSHCWVTNFFGATGQVRQGQMAEMAEMVQNA